MTNADARRCIFRKIEFAAFFEVMDMLCPYIFGNLLLLDFFIRLWNQECESSVVND